MEPMGLAQFAEAVGGRIVGGRISRGDGGGDGHGVGATQADNAVTIAHVATHSGRIRSGAAFFALRGARADGHNYVGAAAANGAAVAVVATTRLENDPGLASLPIPVVAVDDPLRALQRLAARWRASLATRLVAVVGSIGKTVTKDCLVHLLGAGGRVYGAPGSYNSQLGVPLAVLDCPREAATAVIEVAVSEPGEMANLTEVVRPDDVVLTNVGTRWRYRFAARSQQIGELLAMAEGRPVLLGQNDGEVVTAASKLAREVRVHAASADLPVFGRVQREPGAARVDVTFPDQTTAVILVRTPSDEILGDVELAVSAAWLLGVDASAIAAALEDYTPTATRMEIWRSPTGVTLVRDVATPDPIAVGSALRAAKRLTGQGGRTVFVLAPPADADWDEEVITELARALVGEQAEEVLGLRGGDAGVAERAAAAIAVLDDMIPVRLFDSAEGLRRHLVDHLAFGDVCLVQSPPGSRMDALSSSLVEAMAPTRLYLDQSAMDENVTTFRRLVGPSVRIMAMVKALAYGTDAHAVSLGLQTSGVDCLGVSNADEGIALRRAGVNLPILVMLGTEDEVGKILRHRLTPLIYSEAMMAAVCALAKEADGPLAVHVEVDTGMHRAGLDWTTAADRLEELATVGNVRIEGLMTHLASADDPAKDDLTRLQLERFESVVAAARRLGLRPLLHAAATAGTIRFAQARYDLVRLGLGLFGLHPSPATADELVLTPVLSLVSRIVQVIEVPPGEGVGYGGTYVAPPAGGRVGVVPAGYHDCVPRSFSNFGYVVVAGVRCGIIGTVSMDSMTVDLSDCPEAAVGSDVLIYGRSGTASVPLEDVSRIIGTIPYEVLARVGPRVQRVFTRH